MIRVLPYIFALFVLPQVVFAEIHYVPYNARTVLNLEDGDTISLTGFPTDWTYSRVVLGINSTPSVQMSGNITINNCKHTLYSFYQEIAFAYTNEIKIKNAACAEYAVILPFFNRSTICRNASRSAPTALFLGISSSLTYKAKFVQSRQEAPRKARTKVQLPLQRIPPHYQQRNRERL